MARRHPERPALWQRHPGHKDNSLPGNFLWSLVLNAVEHETRSYLVLVGHSTVVLQQLGVAAIAAVASVELYSGRLSPRTTLLVAGLLLVAGWAFAWVASDGSLGRSLPRAAWQVLMLLVGVYNMSPFLANLTRAISTDTVVAAATCMLLFHLYLHDYFFTAQVTDSLSGFVSLSAAVAAAGLVASRLGDAEAAFAYVMLCLELFLLSPYLRRYVRQRSATMHYALTACLVCAPLPSIFARSLTAGVLCVGVCVFVAAVCPLAFVAIDRYKVIPAGPWDEAELEAELLGRGDAPPRPGKT